MKVLNVGGNSKAIPIPACYDGWEHHLLDIDPKGEPDVCEDSRKLLNRTDLYGTYDSVYCSHNLEHYYSHDIGKVLGGFYNILSGTGFVSASVPHMPNVLKAVIGNGLELDDPLYRLADGTPISAHDVMFGWGKQMEESGSDFFAHKTAFTPKSLVNAFNKSGFPFVYIAEQGFNLIALAFKQEPTEEELNNVSA